MDVKLPNIIAIYRCVFGNIAVARLLHRESNVQKMHILESDKSAAFYSLAAILSVGYLQELERIGLLKSRKVGKENLYLNMRLYELLAK